MKGELTKARQAWNSACKAWSADNLDQIEETMRLGEVMMFAATDLIAALETRIERLESVGLTLADTLRCYGYPVSAAHWANASGEMSEQARALHLAAESFRAALSQGGTDEG